jgi:hypothetical protein
MQAIINFGEIQIVNSLGNCELGLSTKEAFEVGKQLIKLAMQEARREIKEIETYTPPKIAALELIAYADFSIDKIEVE